MPETAIIIVNWNGWKDTIECLSSFIHPLPGAHFFIIDNASSDNSIAELRSFFDSTSVSYTYCTVDTLTTGFNAGKQVTLISNHSNQGFAGANNAVLKFLIPLKHYQYAWLLNNDTTVVADSLPKLISKIQTNAAIAFCGSVLLDYTTPQLVQCCGVRHFKYLGVSKLFLKNEEWAAIKNNIPPMPGNIFYQNGASLLTDISKLEQIGLMDERFFLYSEEADWQLRAKQISYTNTTATESVVYHKGSMSTAGKKYIFFYNYNRSAIFMTRKNFGIFASLTATASLLLITIIRAKLNAKSVVHGIKGLYMGWKIAF